MWLANINTKNGVNTVFQNANYTFDRVGNILAISNAAQNTWQKFQYDSLYELVKAEGSAPDKNKTSSYTQTFSYDNIGNMTRKVSVNLLTPGNQKPKELNYDFTYIYGGTRPHAPSQIGNWAYTYDANGNTIKKDRTGLNVSTDIPGGGNSAEYVWNEENRLKEATINGRSTTFLYNANGERTIKRGQGGETLYVNNNFQLQNRQEATKHIFVGTARIVSKLSHYSQSGGLYDSGYERRNIYTYHPDHLGSSSLISDPNGQIFERMEYMPYGETWVDDGANKNVISYKFTSKELDSETGLYYFGARYLDPQVGRWISTDPLFGKYLPDRPINDDIKKKNKNLPGLGGVFNLVNLSIYGYSGNNPEKYIDPNGKAIIIKRDVDQQYEFFPEKTYGETFSISDMKAFFEFLPFGSGNIGYEIGVRLAFIGTAEVVDSNFDTKGLIMNLVNDSAGLLSKMKGFKGMEGYFSVLGTVMDAYSATKQLDTGIYEAGLFDYMKRSGVPTEAPNKERLKAQVEWASQRYNKLIPAEETKNQWNKLMDKASQYEKNK